MNRSYVIIVAIVFFLLFGLYAHWQSGVYRTPLLGSDLSVEEQIVSGGPTAEAIPSIDKPLFESVSAADQYLDNEGYGLVVRSGSHVRFYPYQILVWHEIVNDVMDGKPLLVTYDPLTYTGVLFDPKVKDESLTFGTSGKLLNSNLLMQDRKTKSLWSQATGQAVMGQRKGTALSMRPSLTITWADFKSAYPEGSVLSSHTGVTRDYTHDPYGNYHTSNAVLFPVRHVDPWLDMKTLVFGYATQNGQRAYPTDLIQQAVTSNDTIGGNAICLFWDAKLKTVRGYRRDPNGTPLTFNKWDNNQFIDVETNSVWNADGQAVSGSMRGTTLAPIVLQNSFWFSWAAFYPNTLVYK